LLSHTKWARWPIRLRPWGSIVVCIAESQPKGRSEKIDEADRLHNPWAKEESA
jgi:hypothetical protein